MADQADAAVLKEYGFSDAELATYARDDRKIQVKAARFGDTSGAYGAFTFYSRPLMQREKIPDQGASNNSRVLFYRSNILVDVSLDRVTAMSAADMRSRSLHDVRVGRQHVKGRESIAPRDRSQPIGHFLFR